ncbi:MAG: response regulator [Flavisolibacter sp.]|nr:response regulator [Flavisolibacter sp.]
MQATTQPRIILHVDDDRDDYELVKESILEHDSDISVHGVINGREALLFLERAKTNGGLPGLIILDLNMPVMDGKEFLMALKGDPELSSIPVIIFTTSASPVDKAFAEKYGVEFFVKPPTMIQLSEALKKMLCLFSIGYAVISLNMMYSIKLSARSLLY